MKQTIKRLFNLFTVLVFCSLTFIISCKNSTLFVASPIFIPTYDSFVGELRVEIAQDDGNEIYYKLEGDSNYSLYNEPFVIDSTSIIYAYSQNEDGVKSAEISKKYTCFLGQVSEVVCNELNNENTVWIADETKLELDCSTKDSTIYYTTDGTNPYTSSTRIKYDGDFFVDNECVVKAISIRDTFKESKITSFKVRRKHYNSFLPIFNIHYSDYPRTSGKFENEIIYSMSLPEGNNLVNPKIHYYFNDDTEHIYDYDIGVEFNINAKNTSNFSAYPFQNKDGYEYLDIHAYVVSDDTMGTANLSNLRLEKISKVDTPKINYRIFDKETDEFGNSVRHNGGNVYFSSSSEYIKVDVQKPCPYIVKYVLGDNPPAVYKTPIVISDTTKIDFYIEDERYYSETVSNAYISKVANNFIPKLNLTTDCELGGNKFEKKCNIEIQLPQEAFKAINPKLEYSFKNDSGTIEKYNIIDIDSKTGNYCISGPISIEMLNDTYFNAYHTIAGQKTPTTTHKLTTRNSLKYAEIVITYSADNFIGEQSCELSVQKVKKLDKLIFENADPEEYFVDELDLKVGDPNNSNKRILYRLNGGPELEYRGSIRLTKTTRVEAYVSDGGNYSVPISATFTRDSFSLPNPTTWKNYNGDTIYQYSNIKYNENYRGDGRTIFNLYSIEPITKDTLKKPFVVYVHGGSWNSGDPDEYEDFFERGRRRYAESYLSKYGIPVLSIDYRHLGGGGGRLRIYVDYNALQPFSSWKPLIEGRKEMDLGYYLFRDNGNRISDQVKDIETFFNFVKNHANILRLDTSFAVMDGYSAGGNLELLYSLDGDYEKKIPIKAVIDRVGPADMSSRAYYNFFSSTLCHNRYTPSATIGWKFITADITVYINFINGQYDGEKLLTGMISSAIGEKYNIDAINYVTSRGIDNAPAAIQRISPVWHAKNQRWNKGTYGSVGNYNRPYIVMAYGDNVGLSVKLKGMNTDQEPDASLSGDPLAPRAGGDALAIGYDTNNLLQKSGSSVARNQRSSAYYHGEYPEHYLTFIGSFTGGHDVSSTDSDTTFMKHWSADELRWLREGVDYALQTVCGIKVGQYKP